MSDGPSLIAFTYRALVLGVLIAAVILLAFAVADLDHIRRQQCYTPTSDNGERVILYVKGCR